MSRALLLCWQLLTAGALGALGLLRLSPAPTTAILLYLAAVSPALVTADRAEHRLPNRLVLPGYAVAAAALTAQAVADGAVAAMPLLAGAGYLVLLLVPWLFGGMGLGDVKLAGVLGLGLGAIGPDAAFAGPLLAFMLGGIGAVGVLLAGRGARGRRIPFGPSMLLGFWLVVALSLDC